jgi:thiol-disulfide isomerase/thioredoxin
MKYKKLYTILLCLLISLLSNQVFAKDLFIFGAEWCPACVKLKQFIKNNPSKLSKYKIEMFDVDKHSEIKKELKISKIPTSIIFDDDGTILSRKIGYDSSYTQWLKNNE